ncbi:MAG: M48 family metalloprotease [Thermodesulfobacteriota bacterium]|nr:M48 family metalloprotease [Thermodesulfobacteriota bacterium]
MRQILWSLLIGVALAGCASKDLPPVSQDFSFEEDERRLWLRSEEEQEVLDNSGLICPDEGLRVYLNTIAEKLQPEGISEHIEFNIKVIKNPYLNAFAFPNGIIYVHTGMLARMDNEAQLATLLAHEMTHCTHRHAVKGLRDIKNKTAFLAGVQVTLGGIGGGIGDLTTLLGAVGTMAAVTGHSRDLEREADAEGLRRMIGAGYDPSEASKLFVHLKKELEEEETKEPFFFGSHPRLEERIENYEILLKTECPGGKRGIKNTERFLEEVKPLILDNAELDLKMGRFTIARKGAEKFLALEPENARAFCLLGEIFRQRADEGDSDKAKEHYERAISVDPNYPDAHRGLGLIYYKEGGCQNATGHLDAYLRLSPQAMDRVYIEQYIRQCR